MDVKCEFCGEERECSLVQLRIQNIVEWKILWEGEVCTGCEQKVVAACAAGKR